MLSGDIPQLREIESYVVSGARSGELRRTQVVVDPLVPMHTTERFDQWYRGVPIYGGAVVLDSERGVPVSAFGTMTPTLDITVDPALTADQARTALMRVGLPESSAALAARFSSSGVVALTPVPPNASGSHLRR